MEFNYKIVFNGHIIPFDMAVKNNYISLTSDGFLANDSIKIYQSSGLYDVNYHEIFENDILRSENGKRYIVEKRSGTFFFRERNNEKGCIPLALWGIKFGNRIDTMQIDQL